MVKKGHLLLKLLITLTIGIYLIYYLVTSILINKEKILEYYDFENDVRINIFYQSNTLSNNKIFIERNDSKGSKVIYEGYNDKYYFEPTNEIKYQIFNDSLIIWERDSVKFKVNYIRNY